MDMKAIGLGLKELRKSKGLTMQACADALGITYSSLNQYEGGFKMPRDDTKVKIAHFYGKSVQEIFFSHDAH